MLTTTKKAKAPVKTSDRKRPNRQFIEQMANFRGYMTGNEKTSLATLDVKNAMQRVNNRAMSEDVNTQLSGKQNAEIQRLIKQFVKEINAVIDSE